MTVRHHGRARAPAVTKGWVVGLVCVVSMMAGLWTPFPVEAGVQLLGFVVTPGGPGKAVIPAAAATPPAVYTEPLPLADVYSDSVGATPASFRADESGASTYSVPLYTAPGTAGLGPSLSLEYNSRASNGPLGPGWSLGGLSAIARCKKATEFGDGAGPFPAINFDGVANDQAYCLDGARLLDLALGAGTCPAGQSSDTAHVFGLELDPATRVCGYTKSTITGYAYWLVQPKDGSYRVYGTGGNSALARNNGTGTADTTQYLSWSLNRIADAVGNTVEYSYTQSNTTGELDIAQISYTGKIVTSDVLAASPAFTRATYAAVTFGYATLPAASQRTDYVAGMKLALTQQLSTITMTAPLNNGATPGTAQTVRTYTLSYGTPTASGLAALTSLQECAPNGAAQICYPSTQFTWNLLGAHPIGYPNAPTTKTYSGLQYAIDYKVGDVDGDGRQDLVWLKDQSCDSSGSGATRFQIMVSLANSTGFAPAIASGVYLNRTGVTACNTDMRSFHFESLWYLYDFSGDGRDDLLASNGTIWNIHPAIASGAGYTFDGAHPVSTGMTSSAIDDGIFADLNGDGLPDLIHVNSVSIGGVTSSLLQRASSGTLTFQFATTTTDLNLTLPTLGGVVASYDIGFAPQPGRNLLNADLNGDGASDLLLKVTFDDGICGGGGNKVTHQPGNLTAQGVLYQFDPSSQPDAPSAPCPKHWYTFRNGGVQADTQLHFTYETDLGQTGGGNLVADGSYLSLVDLNGDGQADIVYAKQPVGGTYVYYYRINAGKTGDAATTERFLPEQSTGLSLSQSYAEHVQFVDINGDHRTDIVYQDGVSDSTGSYPLKALVWGASGSTGFGSPTDIGNSTLNAQNPAGIPSFLIDVDGNGGPDLVRVSGGNISVYGYGPTFGGNDFVTQIVNGLGATTQLVYYPLSYPAGYVRSYDAPAENWGRSSPVFDVLSPIWVVHQALSSAPTAANAAAFSSVVYRYGGAKIQAGGRGFLGFKTVQSENQQPTQDTAKYLVTTTEYRQDFPFIGRPDHTVVELETAVQFDPCVSSPGDSCFVRPDPPCGTGGIRCNAAPAILSGTSAATIGVGGQVLSDAADDYVSTPTFVGGTIQQPVMPYLSGSVEQKFDITTAGTFSHGITSAFVEDKYGNVSSSSVVSTDSSGTINETKTTTNHYGCTVTPPTIAGCTDTGAAVSVEAQRQGRLSLSTVTSARPSQTTNTRRASFEYDPTTGQRIADIQGPYDDLEPTAVLKTLGMRSDLIRDANGNVIEQVQCSSYHFGTHAACLAITSLPQRGFDATDATQFQRYAKWDYDSNGRFEVDKKVPFYSASATNNVNEGYAEQVGVTATGALNRDAFGNPLSRISTTGNTTTFVYGRLGRAYFSEDVTGAFAQTTYAWCTDPTTAGIPAGATRVNCPLGAVYRITSASVATLAPYAAQSESPTTWAYFDTLGREMLRTKRIYQPDPTTPSKLHWSSVATTYDSTGRTVTTSTPYFSVDPTAAQATARAGKLQTGAVAAGIATTTYDAVDRPTNQTHPEESANAPSNSQWSFAALTTNAQNPRGYITAQAKNARNEVTQVTAPATQTNALTVSYGRDAVGNITSVNRTPTDGGSAGVLISTGMGYDRLGRKTSMSDPDKHGWSYSYNALGEQVSQTDAKGQKQTVYRDALGRVYQRNENRLSSGSTYISEPTSLWEFDTATRSAGTPILGVLHSETNGVGGFLRTTSYDDIGRVSTVVTSEDSATYTERQSYDQFGRPYQHFDPSTDPASANGELTVYSTDGYPIQTLEAAGGTSGIVYDQVLALSQRGQVTQEEYHQSATLTTTRSYDDNTGRMLSISTAAGALQNWGYDYDKHANLLHRSNTTTGYNLREDFGYDNLDRLQSVNLTVNGVAGAALTVGYDQLGNLLSKQATTTQNWTYGTQPSGCAQSAGPHAASTWNGNKYCYDLNGNQTLATFANGQTRSITYTGYDLPAQIVTNGTPSVATESFSYAPDRSMFKRVEGVNGPGDRIFCSGFETTPCPSGNTPRTYYIGNVEVRINGTTVTTKRNLGSYLVITTSVTGTTTTGPTYAYLFRDALGSIDVITSETGTVIQRQAFDAWGNRRDASTTGAWTILPAASAAAFDTSTTYQGFTGHQQLDPVGLIHMKGRLYDPQLGRFIQADPMTEADPTQGLNRYTYVQNNPLSLTDPSGYLSFRSIVGIAIGVAAAFFSGGLFLAGEYWASFAVATAGGFASAYVATGSLKAGLWGAFAAGVFWGVGSYFQNASWAHDDGLGCTKDLTTGAQMAKIAAHAAAGGVINDLRGGNFGSGFLAAGATEALSPAVEKLPGAARPFAAALVGGTVSKAAGGSFANGAETAFFQQLFNHIAHPASTDGGGYRDYDTKDPNYHEYSVLTLICDASQQYGCSAQYVFSEGLDRYPAPFMSGDYVSDNDVRNVTGFGPVRFQVFEENMEVINETLPGHLLEPGYVDRQVIQVGDSVYIQTHGVGVGNLADMNSAAAGLMWHSVDAQIANSLHGIYPPSTPRISP